MKHKNVIRFIAKTLGLAMLLTMCANSYAQEVQFRVGFEDVHGSRQLEEGKIEEGIQILQKELAKEHVDRGRIVSTLCGAYLLDKTLVRARPFCEEAANAYPNSSTLNNYGVYLAISGDLEGAMKSFKRAQSLQRGQYVEFLNEFHRANDIGSMVLQNVAVLRDYQSGEKREQSETVTLTARNEDLTKGPQDRRAAE